MVCHILWFALEECLRHASTIATRSSLNKISSLENVGADYWKGTFSLLYSSAHAQSSSFLFVCFGLRFFPKEN